MLHFRYFFSELVLMYRYMSDVLYAFPLAVAAVFAFLILRKEF